VCHTMLPCDLIGQAASLLHAHMKFNYQRHRLQLQVSLCSDVMHFHRCDLGSLVLLGTSGVKVQRFLTFLREVTATFVFWSESLATHES
jgi:hypothetical protein